MRMVIALTKINTIKNAMTKCKNPQLEHATNVLVENGIDITPLEDTIQNEDCVYD